MPLIHMELVPDPGSGVLPDWISLTSVIYVAAYVGTDWALKYSLDPSSVVKPMPMNTPVPLAASVTAYYPGSDISVAGWTASTGTDLFACVDETTLDDGDYITSPDSTTSTIMGWNSPVPAGAWSLAIRPMFPEGTSGQIRLVMLDSGNSAVGTSAWQTLTGSFVTYTLAITTSGVSDRFRLEIQP